MIRFALANMMIGLNGILMVRGTHCQSMLQLDASQNDELGVVADKDIPIPMHGATKVWPYWIVNPSGRIKHSIVVYHISLLTSTEGPQLHSKSGKKARNGHT